MTNLTAILPGVCGVSTFNGAISPVAAETTEGAGESVSFAVVLFSDFIQAAAGDLCPTTTGIESGLRQTSVSRHAEALGTFSLKCVADARKANLAANRGTTLVDGT